MRVRGATRKAQTRITRTRAWNVEITGSGKGQAADRKLLIREERDENALRRPSNNLGNRVVPRLKDTAVEHRCCERRHNRDRQERGAAGADGAEREEDGKVEEGGGVTGGHALAAPATHWPLLVHELLQNECKKAIAWSSQKDGRGGGEPQDLTRAETQCM
jgi:hypothetical protein